ncbi:MAG TPA: hypothetical protein VH328_06530 [Burkholderiaceae bacterium]|nr:hypothetical protein [Burkholderiaceae bacterium]
MHPYPPIVFASEGRERAVRFLPPDPRPRTRVGAATAPRFLRDAAVMVVVGPLAGVIAVVALQGLGVLRQASPVAPTAVVSPAAPVPRATVQPMLPSSVTLPSPAPPHRNVAEFGAVSPTPDARHMADWVVSRADNGTLPFFVIDKRDARLYVFQADGVLLGSSPVLLGAARGDDSFPGIGDVPIAQVKPWQRTTPAGRFVTQPGLDDERHDVVWVDYGAAVAMHRVINKVRSEQRPERLATPSPKDNRISFGCINVPIPFFESMVSPVFGKHRGVAYVIPEVRSFHQVFEEHANDAPVLATAGSTTQPMAPAAVR